MQLRIIFFIILITSIKIFAANKAKQVEDLFIWKISDELRLSVREEKSFSDLIRKINKDKFDLTNEIDQLTLDLKNAKDLKQLSNLLKKYKIAMQKYNQTSTNEIEKIEKLMGQEKTARYIVLKSDFTSKIKLLLSTANDSANAADKLNNNEKSNSADKTNSSINTNK